MSARAAAHRCRIPDTCRSRPPSLSGRRDRSAVRARDDREPRLRAAVARKRTATTVDRRRQRQRQRRRHAHRDFADPRRRGVRDHRYVVRARAEQRRRDVRIRVPNREERASTAEHCSQQRRGARFGGGTRRGRGRRRGAREQHGPNGEHAHRQRDGDDREDDHTVPLPARVSQDGEGSGARSRRPRCDRPRRRLRSPTGARRPRQQVIGAGHRAREERVRCRRGDGRAVRRGPRGRRRHPCRRLGYRAPGASRRHPAAAQGRRHGEPARLGLGGHGRAAAPAPRPLGRDWIPAGRALHGALRDVRLPPPDHRRRSARSSLPRRDPPAGVSPEARSTVRPTPGGAARTALRPPRSAPRRRRSRRAT
ncbi:MAG: hypothetical protein JWM72_1460 [Actinomycetia bacterium]|nr:hypothetical protein [Actinomycetes bacterium]